MELELQRACLEGFELLLDRCVAWEETMEGIVPDTRPDIMRIVDAAGQIFLTGRELSAGSVRISGVARTTVLYIPDGEEGIRQMEFNLPFACSVDDPAIHGGCRVWAVPRLCSVDAGAINPRKIILRGEVAVDVRVYAPAEQSFCTGAHDGGQGYVQQRLEERETCVISGVGEKAFSFSDVLELPAARPRSVELLRSRVELGTPEARMIGGKLILKGVGELTAVCRGEEGDPVTVYFQLPYSQILDMGGVGEECEPLAECAVTGMECALQGGDPGALAVTLELVAWGAATEKRKVTLLTDLYATNCPVEVKRETFGVHLPMACETKRVGMRRLCECGIPAKTVVDTRLSVGRVTVGWEEETPVFRAETAATVLFLSEDDALCSVTYPLPVVCEWKGAGRELPACRCIGVGGVTAVPVTGGFEVRFEVEFILSASGHVASSYVGDVRVLPVPEGGKDRPSAVLRMVDEGEELWDLAKAYQSTIEDIMAANELEDDRAPCGCMLLIPRRR